LSSRKHLNSVTKDDKGNYLFSSRHCASLFYVAPNGTVLWSMGGKYSNFTGTDFHWQHDARWRGENTISLFDNAANSWEETGTVARGVVLDIDMDAKSVTQRTYDAPTGLTSESQGSFQLLPNGNYLAGWGSEPYLTEFADNGTVLWSAQFGTAQSGYRAIKANWTGYPTTKPSMQYNVSGDTVEIKVSWSGATEVFYWMINSDTDDVGRADHTTFEDTISVQQTAVEGKQWVQVTGHDAEGGALGSSDRWLIGDARSETVSETRTIGTASFSAQQTSATAGSAQGSASPSASSSPSQGSAANQLGISWMLVLLGLLAAGV